MFKKLISFLQESKQELSRVNWPTQQETARLTLVVIALSILVAAFLGALDYLFAYLLEVIILN